ncbi:MAG: divalent metal cation transporter [Elusimicrobia bacterium]|nr:divalent metal cation transporter [Elusimicrobiota bacterium]
MNGSAAPRAVRVGSLFRGGLMARLAFVVGVLGPGMITANVDNDAGGIATYTLAGAHFGFDLLWTIPVMAVILGTAQVLSARMAVATGKGFAELTRENCGIKLTFWLMLLLVLNDCGNMVANFAGIAAAAGLFGVPKVVSVPLAGAFVWWLVTQGNYNRIERVFLLACLFYLCYFVSSYLVSPDWLDVGRAIVMPRIHWTRDYWIMLVGLVGATIAPWQLYVQQAMTVEKGLKPEDYWLARLDAVIGSVASMAVVAFIIVTCAVTLHVAGIQVDSAEQAALALKPLAGPYCFALFGTGLLIASVIAAAVLALSATYNFCGSLGWEMGLDYSFKEAPQFYFLYTFLIAFGGIVVLWPGFPLLKVMFWTQVLNGILLPIVLWLQIYLSDSRDVMGDMVNAGLLRAGAWSIAVALSLLSLSSMAGIL